MKLLFAAVSAIGMLILILDPRTALLGASEGISLCIRSVIPSLFPFFVLSMVLTDALQGMKIPFLRPIGKLCGIPPGGEGLLIVSFLGGYPVGARGVVSLYQTGQISAAGAKRLLSFCSNAGPAFIFGIVSAQFSTTRAGLALWLNHILSALIVGIFLPAVDEQTVQIPTGKPQPLSKIVSDSIRVLASVCGWVVLFRIGTAFLWKVLPAAVSREARVVIAGILELTGGCCALTNISDPSLRFAVAAAMLSFGGLCVLMQTASVCGSLGIGSYLKGKLLQAVISLFLALCSAVPGVLLVICAVFCREIKNRSRKTDRIVV